MKGTTWTQMRFPQTQKQTRSPVAGRGCAPLGEGHELVADELGAELAEDVNVDLLVVKRAPHLQPRVLVPSWAAD